MPAGAQASPGSHAVLVTHAAPADDVHTSVHVVGSTSATPEQQRGSVYGGGSCVPPARQVHTPPVHIPETQSPSIAQAAPFPSLSWHVPM